MSQGGSCWMVGGRFSFRECEGLRSRVCDVVDAQWRDLEEDLQVVGTQICCQNDRHTVLGSHLWTLSLLICVHTPFLVSRML
jgi:hypothetical protein